MSNVIELDVCYADHEGETLQQALDNMTRGTAVEVEVLQLRGPAGGWPFVRFTGTTAELVLLTIRYNGGSVSGVEEELEALARA